jgi:hypothetical protein
LFTLALFNNCYIETRNRNNAKNESPHDKKYTTHAKEREKKLNHSVTFKKARRNT